MILSTLQRVVTHRVTNCDRRECSLSLDYPDRIPQLVDTRRAAEILGRSPATLKRWRYEGIGPEYVEMERRVSYDVEVLVQYIRQNTRMPSVRAAMEDSRGAL